MIGKLYDLLDKIGYIHSMHPPFIHGPIGGVIVEFLLWHVVVAAVAISLTVFPSKRTIININ